MEIIIAAAIAAIPPLLAIMLKYLSDNKKRLEDIHVLVNGNLHEALRQNKELRERLGVNED